MTKLVRWTTWAFRFRQTISGVAQNLNGYKIWLNIKPKRDSVDTDTTAVIEQYALISSAVTEKLFVISADDTKIPEWFYVQGFRYQLPGGGESYTSDFDFECVLTAVNKLTPPS